MSAKWWRLTITSLSRKVRRRERVISSRVRPESSTRALGRVSVRGFRRVPRPAARIMAFIGDYDLLQKEKDLTQKARSTQRAQRRGIAYRPSSVQFRISGSLEGFPVASFFQLEMAHDNLQTVPGAQMPG